MLLGEQTSLRATNLFREDRKLTFNTYVVSSELIGKESVDDRRPLEKVTIILGYSVWFGLENAHKIFFCKLMRARTICPHPCKASHFRRRRLDENNCKMYKRQNENNDNNKMLFFNVNLCIFSVAAVGHVCSSFLLTTSFAFNNSWDHGFLGITESTRFARLLHMICTPCTCIFIFDAPISFLSPVRQQRGMVKYQ